MGFLLSFFIIKGVNSCYVLPKSDLGSEEKKKTAQERAAREKARVSYQFGKRDSDFMPLGAEGGHRILKTTKIKNTVPRKRSPLDVEFERQINQTFIVVRRDEINAGKDLGMIGMLNKIIELQKFEDGSAQAP